MSLPPRFTPEFHEDLSALLAWRRDVRRFRRGPVAEDVVAQLLATAQLAPSVGNSQPWRFVRVRSPGLREALIRHVDGEAARAGEAMPDPERRAAYGALKLHGLDHAPEVIAVFCDDATDIGGGLGAATMPQTREWSVVMAIHTLWLAARANGLGLGWVSIADPDTVTALSDVPQGWRFIALLCLGEPEEPHIVPELERLGWQARLDGGANVSER
ncbi:Cob(II)yrinic acid a c-diamide reductase [Novosphingobium barchaimii LL02]|uniref:Cob(II)yrinic acid a c-diamide reductase n=1 Tax=Novosphingobium barchaimii LL02 TaxID=1114963 RepID=A0A0J7XH43_9SPHN|nr:5,6-dimethylbenzimidazole synthase [Novosphingobium barchaimii]KMS51077.1 Cob(II)yrinic acid a c-diamide reductase [Novosphingobium barchaimii LL02]